MNLHTTVSCFDLFEWNRAGTYEVQEVEGLLRRPLRVMLNLSTECRMCSCLSVCPSIIFAVTHFIQDGQDPGTCPQQWSKASMSVDILRNCCGAPASRTSFTIIVSSFTFPFWDLIFDRILQRDLGNGDTLEPRISERMLLY